MTFGSRLTVSPQRSSNSQGGTVEERTCGIVKDKTNQHVRMDEDKVCLPVEKENTKAISMKVLPSPSSPSRQEMLEHNITHAIQELVSPLPGWQSEVDQAHAGCRSGSQRDSNHQHGLHVHG